MTSSRASIPQVKSSPRDQIEQRGTRVRRSIAAFLTLAAVVVTGCGEALVEDEVVHTFSDGSVDTVASATDSELRSAAVAMEIIYTKNGTYGDGDLLAEMESLGNGRRYPIIELRTIEASNDAFCVEGGKDGYVKHVRSGELTPQDGGC